VLAAGSIIDRSGGAAGVGVPRVALATLKVVAHPPDGCPLCREGLPVTKPALGQSELRAVMRRVKLTLAYDGTDYHGGRSARTGDHPGYPRTGGRRDRRRSRQNLRLGADRCRRSRAGQVAAFDLHNPSRFPI